MTQVNQSAKKILDLLTDGLHELNACRKIDNNKPGSGIMLVSRNKEVTK